MFCRFQVQGWFRLDSFIRSQRLKSKGLTESHLETEEDPLVKLLNLLAISVRVLHDKHKAQDTQAYKKWQDWLMVATHKVDWKSAEGICTVETDGFSPRSGALCSVPCMSVSGGQWVCDVTLKNLWWNWRVYNEGEKSTVKDESQAEATQSVPEARRWCSSWRWRQSQRWWLELLWRSSHQFLNCSLFMPVVPLWWVKHWCPSFAPAEHATK